MIFGAGDDVSMAQLVVSGIMLAMLGLATTLVTILTGRSKRTEDALYTSGGVSVSEQLTRMEGRISANEDRMNGLATRIGNAEVSATKAHSRIDDVAGNLAIVRIDHEGRLVVLENQQKGA